MSVAVVRAIIVPRLPNLGSNRPPKHVQSLMTLIPGLEQSPGRLPHLRRRVLPQLRRDDPVHDQMETRVDGTARAVELPDARLQRLLEFGMLGPDHHCAQVLVSEVFKPQLELRHHGGIGNELLTCPLILD